MAIAVWELDEPAPRPRVQLQVVQGHRGRPARPSAEVFRRRRVVALALLVVTFVALALLLRVGAAVLGGDPASAPEPRPLTVSYGGQELVAGGTYVVQPGDTMWAIARALQPAGDVDGLVRRLVRLNGGPELDVGEIVVLPA